MTAIDGSSLDSVNISESLLFTCQPPTLDMYHLFKKMHLMIKFKNPLKSFQKWLFFQPDLAVASFNSFLLFFLPLLVSFSPLYFLLYTLLQIFLVLFYLSIYFSFFLMFTYYIFLLFLSRCFLYFITHIFLLRFLYLHKFIIDSLEKKRASHIIYFFHSLSSFLFHSFPSTFFFHIFSFIFLLLFFIF